MAGRGGKIRRRGGNEFFDVGPQRGLVVFDGQQKVGPVFEHQLARGLVLGVEGVEADFASVQVEPVEQRAGHGDFVGLLIHQRAAQEVLDRDGRMPKVSRLQTAPADENTMPDVEPKLLAEFLPTSKPN